MGVYLFGGDETDFHFVLEYQLAEWVRHVFGLLEGLNYLEPLEADFNVLLPHRALLHTDFGVAKFDLFVLSVLLSQLGGQLDEQLVVECVQTSIPDGGYCYERLFHHAILGCILILPIQHSWVIGVLIQRFLMHKHKPILLIWSCLVVQL